MDCHGLISGGCLPILLATEGIPSSAIIFHCAIGALGMFLLLPSWRSRLTRIIGGALLALSLLILTMPVLHGNPGPNDGFYFWSFSAIALISAIRVVTHPRPVYAALYFVLTVLASAGLFVLLSADFLAAALVLIYAGAILVTYVFVIMLASQASSAGVGNLGGLADYDVTSREPVLAVIVGFSLMAVLTFLVFDRAYGMIPPPAHPVVSTEGQTQALGQYLFHRQLVNVELAGLILTLAMIGAIMVTRRRILEPAVGLPVGASGEDVLGPATPVNDDPHSVPVIGTRNPAQKAYPQT
ncbi:MAG TPA: NADH-quinone oxidoreductase subunit J [Tepidisphaeraceae bacterium]|nr:NADH-quinone oxidoreductase subunit J [Tepidisphaeraceae bacterium]